MDRRKGPPAVSPLHFWLGIAVSLITIVGMAIKIGNWTGQVDMSVRQMTNSVDEFKTMAKTLVTEHNQMRLDIQHNRDVNTEIERRITTEPSRKRPVPVFEGESVH